MKWLFCHDTYYARDAKGRIYAHGAFPADLWVTRFLPHCDGMAVIGRTAAFQAGDEKRLPLSSAGNVDFILLENINAPLKRLLGSSAVKCQIRDAVRKADGVIIRGPSEIGMLAGKYARQMNKPYAVEMSGCAFDHLWHHGLNQLGRQPQTIQRDFFVCVGLGGGQTRKGSRCNIQAFSDPVFKTIAGFLKSRRTALFICIVLRGFQFFF